MILPSQRAARRRAPMAEINVTPMVDVMLVLLIIFMVTAPLLASGVPITLPDARAKPLDQDAKPIQLAIDAGGAIFLDDKPVSAEALPDALTRAAARGSNRQVFLRADAALGYGRVMRVMGEVSRAGLTRVAMVTIPPDGPR